MASFSSVLAMHTEARLMIASSLQASDLAKCVCNDVSASAAFADGLYWQASVEQEAIPLVVDPVLFSAAHRNTVMTCLQLLRHVTFARGATVRLNTHEEATRLLRALRDAQQTAVANLAKGGRVSKVCIGSFALREAMLGSKATFPFSLPEELGGAEGMLDVRIGTHGKQLLIGSKLRIKGQDAVDSTQRRSWSNIRLSANVTSVASHLSLRYRDMRVHLDGQVQSCANGIWAATQRSRAKDGSQEEIGDATCVMCINDGAAKLPSASLAHSLHLDLVKRRPTA